MAFISGTREAASAARHNRNVDAQDVMCGQMRTCVLHTADSFGNALLHGGVDVQAHLSMQTPDGSHTAKVHPLATSCEHAATCASPRLAASFQALHIN